MSLSIGEDLQAHVPTNMEFILQNEQVFDNFHETAEQASPLFAELHPIFTEKLSDLDRAELAEAFSRGLSLYEIVAAFDPATRDELSGKEGALALGRAKLFMRTMAVGDLIDAAHENLEDSRVETPRLIDFSREVLGRYVRGSASELNFGLIGVSAGRQWHMSAVDEKVTIMNQLFAEDDSHA